MNHQGINIKAKFRMMFWFCFLQAGEFFTEMQPIFHPDDKMYLDLLEILYEQLLSKEDYRGTLEANLQILQHYHRYGNTGYGVSSLGIQNYEDFCLKIYIHN